MEPPDLCHEVCSWLRHLSMQLLLKEFPNEFVFLFLEPGTHLSCPETTTAFSLQLNTLEPIKQSVQNPVCFVSM